MGSIERIVESIVLLIQAIFSFLPSWCTVFVGSAFVVVVAIVVYKFIRG